jgi:hypothetical protein
MERGIAIREILPPDGEVVIVGRRGRPQDIMTSQAISDWVAGVARYTAKIDPSWTVLWRDASGGDKGYVYEHGVDQGPAKRRAIEARLDMLAQFSKRFELI